MLIDPKKVLAAKTEAQGPGGPLQVQAGGVSPWPPAVRWLEGSYVSLPK